MAWIEVLSQPNITVTVDDERKVCMLETVSGGSVPRYVTVQFSSRDELDELIRGLEQARALL